MANTINDIPIPSTNFVNLNTVSGIAVGTPLIITNKGIDWGLLYIGNTQPEDESLHGEIICSLPRDTAIKFICEGEEAVWARATGNTPLLFSVQDNS